MRHLTGSLGLIVLIAALGGCCSSAIKQKALPATSVNQQLDEGYSLLYKLMDDESKVGKLFIIRSADKPITELVKQIGQSCKAAKERLDQFAGANQQIHFDMGDLPYIELQSRKLQASDDRHALLFAKGDKFERRLIFTQAQAMNYGVQLCRALQKEEQNPIRKAFLHDLEVQCRTLHDRLMNFLKVAS
ncbi:MAG TPA: hypothetical protein VG722_05400 [Tepidisphaeraceae bacterium]|nr:hypothetical protein [Tepidisphaeraceae bacterium]